MSNLINLLPTHIANQIAAGEVIQRPGSAVKELLENAVDAGATEIRLIVEDAGKAVLQVVDNGKGMSETDALNCFERHATSKIAGIEDLQKIKTMGFRGEALASVAAVSQVQMRTRREGDELGTEIEIENSRVLKQESCACPVGTSISMKNLFFNVPARRNFLKGNVVELKHITDEFIRVALAFPGIFFSLSSNGQEVFHLDKGNLKQRVVQLMGNAYATKLVQVDEKTDYLDITGFIGKPETAKKTRGDQYLFVNNRFVRNAYLNHAIVSAYEELIPQGSFPFFALFIDLDPANVDVNVHPTKQEIKFQDEKLVYAFIKSAIRHALAQFSIAPAIDFGLDAGIQQLDAISKPFTRPQQDEVRTSGLYKSFVDRNQAHRIESSSNLSSWRDFFDQAPKSQLAEQSSFQEFQPQPGSPYQPSSDNALPKALGVNGQSSIHQIHLSYIVFEQPNGMTIMHQQLAHQQVLFEKFNSSWQGKGMPIQQNLFPIAIQLSPTAAQLLQSILPDLLQMGYQLEPFGNNAFLLQGSPADHPSENNQSVIEMIIEDVKDAASTLHHSYKEKIAKTLARKHAVKAGTKLDEMEMLDLVERLSQCKNNVTHFDGKPIYVEVKNDYLSDIFRV
jgi:DNA mismatch repair protein MutL